MIKLEKRDLVLSVDWLGVLSVHLEPGPLFFASMFFFILFPKLVLSVSRPLYNHRILVKP